MGAGGRERRIEVRARRARSAQEAPAGLPPPLLAIDGLVEGAPPEDVFTWDTVSRRLPSIVDAVLETLPEEAKKCEGLVRAMHSLQSDMREGAPLQELRSPSPWVDAKAWNA